MATDRFRRFEKESEVLKVIAANYSEGSPEYDVIRRATLALMYVNMEHAAAFEAFIQECNKDSTRDAENYLNQLEARARKPTE